MIISNDNFIKHFRKGKEAALEYVIDEFMGIVKAVTYNTIKIPTDPHLIEESISDTFLGAFENAKQFKGNQEDFRKWICTIARFKAIDKQRKILRNPVEVEISDVQISVMSAEEQFFINESSEELYKMLKNLNEVDRDIFIMKYFLNMGNKDIAIHLGLTTAAVDNRLYRGKEKLRKFCIGGTFS